MNTKIVKNYMGGESFTLNPLDTLKMVAASSIFSEPKYYNEVKVTNTYYRHKIREKNLLLPHFVFNTKVETPKHFMEKVIDEALNYDFYNTLLFAKELRNDYLVRLNPQVIMVRAALNPYRATFNKIYPGVFSSIEKDVLKRADDPLIQADYYLNLKGGKENLPSILKRNWKDKLESLSRYEVNKYKNKEIGLINLVRLTHANNETIDELMKNGKVNVKESEEVWESLKSKGLSWREILSEIKLPHMALLRNLRGIFSSLTEDDFELSKKVLEELVKGAKNGKQFPFRYYVAYKMISGLDINFKEEILDALNTCLNDSIKEIPYLKGNTVILSDNSGSAWGSFVSSYGSAAFAEIGNLSAVLTAYRSDKGTVAVFGDRIEYVEIDKEKSILENLDKVNEVGKTVGFSTENGIWLFFEKAITEKIHVDNLFIYSDMQAGRGELYCTLDDFKNYSSFMKENNLKMFTESSRYVNVLELLRVYRAKVNGKVNVFSVQTGGYKDNLLPDYLYRGALLYGWTGKEAMFADKLISIWDNVVA